MDTSKRYKAVFFDLGGTLRIALLEEAWMRHGGGDRRLPRAL